MPHPVSGKSAAILSAMVESPIKNTRRGSEAEKLKSKKLLMISAKRSFIRALFDL
jgi:hypothetical protein